MKTEIEKTLAHIVSSIRAAGYDPYEQIYGYLKTGEDVYITRSGDARTKIKSVNREQLEQCLAALNDERSH